jgi:predicted Ser/Thr protein kinase
MTSGSDPREVRLDLRLGTMAVRKGLLTAAQLDEALQEQQLGVKRGRKKPRRLGAVLIDKHFLTDDQVIGLLEEQEARIVAVNRQRADDLLLGRILVDGGFSTAEAVEECLRLQDSAIRTGLEEIPLLGDLLIKKGHATPQVIEEALELQKGVPLVCGRCGDHCMSGAMDLARLESCSKCGGPLQPVATQESAPPAPSPAPSPPPAPAPPELKKLGKYSIHGLLGRGGMGEVYEALDSQLNRKVALKVIRGEHDGVRPGSVERFIQEARLAARLSKHPHIVSVHEADVADGRHYIAMELVQGKTLGEWRRKNAPSLRQQVKVLRTVALAVHYAHEHGVLHRDLKPGNVLVDDQQRPFVTDFGLALAENHEDRMKCGSPSYVSPEQAQGLPGIDRRSDVYSLGVMLYEILEGRPPFRESTRAATLKRVIHDPVPPLSSLGRLRPFSTVDEDIGGICLKALAKKPEERTGTAEEFAGALGRWLDRKTPTADTTAIPVWSRNPARLWVAAAAAAAIVLAGAAAFRGSSSGDRANLSPAGRMMAEGDWAKGFELYDQAVRAYPSDAQALAGREEARRRLVARALAELDKALLDLDKAREDAEVKARRKAQTLDQEQRFADEKVAARELVRKTEDRVRAARDEAQRLLTLGVR